MDILIAEDDMTSRHILKSIVKKWGFIPVTAVNGKDAWQVMRSQDAPRLAIVDWQMPEMDGIELCRKIRSPKTNDPAYLIILTSRDRKKDIVDALNAGANDFVSKPYNTEELRARLNVGRRMLMLQSDLANAYKALEHEAMHDQLTGVYNRKAILNILQKEITRAGQGDQILLLGMCDLDYFKQVNDTYGHQAGDSVLKKFTQTLGPILREKDRLGRYGGEEFLVIVPDCGHIQGFDLFETMRRHIAETLFPAGNTQIRITVSIGVARYDDRDDVDSFLARADATLYHAKQGGRNRVIFNQDAASR